MTRPADLDASVVEHVSEGLPLGGGVGHGELGHPDLAPLEKDAGEVLVEAALDHHSGDHLPRRQVHLLDNTGLCSGEDFTVCLGFCTQRNCNDCYGLQNMNQKGIFGENDNPRC